MSPNFKNPTVDMEFYLMGCFFLLFLGLFSDKFHYNNVSSKGRARYCFIKNQMNGSLLNI